MNTKYLVIYHKEDNDGIISAALVHYHLTKRMRVECPAISMMPADYTTLNRLTDEEIDNLQNEYENIIMVDISFNNAKRMLKLKKMFGPKFVWCDHHKPIIDESFRLGFDDVNGIRDTSKSAILCVYQYLFDPFNEKYNDKKVPEILRILSGWDSWSFEREGYTNEFCQCVNKAVTVGLSLDVNFAFEFIDWLFIHDSVCFIRKYGEKTVKELYDIGKTLIDYDNFNNYQLIYNNGDFEWKLDGDRNACALFIQGPSNSLMFKELRNGNNQNGIVFKRTPTGDWTVSLYNVNDWDDFHCGEYLKSKYNGGGHKGAAGCTISEAKFLKILKSKQL